MQGLRPLLHHRDAARAAESDIIIVNHHLFFADLSIKLEAEGAPDAGVLPDCGAVIFDEAHELEDIAGNYFGISVSNLRMDELTRDVEQMLQREKLYTPQMSGAIQSSASARSCSFRFCPRTKAALPSTPAANSWKKTEKNFWH
jgi:ATP-dependent DNA helicase DinG